jgi:uncharacterized membrane protein YhaH (DUF805 family)
VDWKWLLTSFDGRINRAKFWAGIGVLIVLGIAATVIDVLIDSSIDIGGGAQMGIVSLLVSLASVYLALALYAKRWHDRDKSGWWSLIALVPFIGAIWILVELGMLEGTRGANQYGPDPLA